MCRCGRTSASVTVGCRPDGLSSLRKTGRAHCAVHRVRAREYGFVRTCTDLYGLVRTLLRRRLRRADGTWCSGCHALWNFDSTGLCVLLAGRAHCAMPILRAKNVGLVGQVGLVGRLALGAVSAMCCGNFKAQGYVGAMRSRNSKAQGAEVGQNIPVHSLTHGARPFGAERAGA